MRIVLLGAAGYIGAVATRHLLRAGHHVTAVDSLIYQRGDQPAALLPGAEFVAADLRDGRALLRICHGSDAVVHLGGLVGEPACALDEDLAVELNYASPMIAARAALEVGVARFVLFSSCSVYGQREGTVDEHTPVHPLGIYARTKALAEADLAKLLEGRASLSVLRLATVHGRSPRQRLDSVVNKMTAQAVATGLVPLHGGAQRRPVVHVADVADVLARVLADSAPPSLLNVGSDRENHTIAEIAAAVEAAVDGARIQAGPERDEADARDYNTNFSRLAAWGPGTCPTTLAEGIREIAAAFAADELGDADLPEYDNLRGLQAALAANRIYALRTPECRDAAAAYTENYGSTR